MPGDGEVIRTVVSWTCGFFILAMTGVAIPVMLSFLPDAIHVWARRGEARPALVLLAVVIGLGVLSAFESSFTGTPGTPTTTLWFSLGIVLGLSVALAACCFTVNRLFRRAGERRRVLRAVKGSRPAGAAAAAGSATPDPVERLSARGAEYLAQDWMRYLGVTEAVVTPERRDGGVDVRSRDFVAQVKHLRNEQIGVAAIRQLSGVATAEHRRGLFFSTSGYTRDALAFARENGVALFVVRYQHGRLVPHGALAQQYLDGGLNVHIRRASPAAAQSLPQSRRRGSREAEQEQGSDDSQLTRSSQLRHRRRITEDGLILRRDVGRNRGTS